MRHIGLVSSMAALAAGIVFAPAAGAVTPAGPQIEVVSNRADLVSDGNALVEVRWPPGTNLAAAKISLNGTLITSSFATRANGRYMGLVTGLVNGDNRLIVQSRSGGAQITIRNHPRGGPVFSGTQLEPWVCARQVATPVVVSIPGTSHSALVTTRASGLASDPVDDDCNAAPLYSHYYQPKALEGANCVFGIASAGGVPPCFVAFPSINNPSSRPADSAIADFTNDRGDTVKSIIRVERGAINRGIYQLVTFHDPAQPLVPWDPQKGWNGKLLWRMGANTSYSRFQSPPGTSIFDDKSLRRGFMVASSSLTDHGTNGNDTLGAELVMMVKERVQESYGPIRYTIGDGCSGGAIAQLAIANAYPGLLDGVQPFCTYQDAQSPFIEIGDCGMLVSNYYTTTNGSMLSTAKRVAINGHASLNFCQVWITSFLSAGNPSSNAFCGTGWPAALTYHPTLRPNGVRCSGTDHNVSMVGTFVDTDGNTKARQPFDNEGVQYGLKALRDGVITAEEFVRLNEGVGGYSHDLVWSASNRMKADPDVVHVYYSSGLMSDGRQLAKVPIIDMRGNQTAGGDIHMNWRTWGVRDRLDRDFGGHGNQVIWGYTGGGAGTPGAALVLRAFLTMDQWLANIEADSSAVPLEQKVLNNKPAQITGLLPARPVADFCMNANGSTDAQLAAGVAFGQAPCPITFQSSPRQVAGGPLAENIYKCQLKTLDFGDPDYGATLFTPAQQTRLMTVFATGVCDWSKPGVSQVPTNPWTTFQAGPGGVPLGPAPTSHPFP